MKCVFVFYQLDGLSVKDAAEDVMNTARVSGVSTHKYKHSLTMTRTYKSLTNEQLNINSPKYCRHEMYPINSNFLVLMDSQN